MTVKSFSLLARPDDLDHDAFAATWGGEHAALVRDRVPAGLLERFVQDAVVPLTGRPLPHAGVATTVVGGHEDLDRLRQWYAGPDGDDLRGLVPRLAGDDPVGVATTEHVLGGRDDLFDADRRRAQPGSHKVVAFLHRRAGITTEEFARYWEDEHGPFAQSFVPRGVFGYGYVQNHAITDDEGEPAWDGVAEMYFRDRAAIQRWGDWFRSDAGRPLREDEYNFMDPDRRLVLVTTEQVVIP